MMCTSTLDECRLSMIATALDCLSKLRKFEALLVTAVRVYTNGRVEGTTRIEVVRRKATMADSWGVPFIYLNIHC